MTEIIYRYKKIFLFYKKREKRKKKCLHTLGLSLPVVSPTLLFHPASLHASCIFSSFSPPSTFLPFFSFILFVIFTFIFFMWHSWLESHHLCDRTSAVPGVCLDYSCIGRPGRKEEKRREKRERKREEREEREKKKENKERERRERREEIVFI